MERVRASYSKGMYFSTIFFTIVLLCASCYMFYRMSKYHEDLWYFLMMGCAAIVLGTLVYAYVSQLKYVYISKDYLILKKKIGNITIPINSIKQVQPKKNIIYDIRLWGISGLFGHIGWFWNKKLGKYFALVKNEKDMFIIQTYNNKFYVVSCDNSVEVIKQLVSLLKKEDTVPMYK